MWCDYYTYLDVLWLAKEQRPIRRVESLNNIICEHQSCVARDYDDECAFKILYQTYHYYNITYTPSRYLSRRWAYRLNSDIIIIRAMNFHLDASELQIIIIIIIIVIIIMCSAELYNIMCVAVVCLSRPVALEVPPPPII